MIREINFRKLSKGAMEEIYRACGITDEDINWLRLRGSPVGAVEFPDRYKVSHAQQKKAHALIHAVSRWDGYTPLEVEKAITKTMFLDSEMPTLGDTFSLANCSMEVARLYITWLIDFCLLYDVPCGEPMYKLCEDIPKYIYACILNHRCCICGKKNELHHVDAVGMGRNRKEIIHWGMRVLPLCRHHHQEIHNMGRDSFLQTYIIEPVRADERICQEYGLKVK